MKVDGSMRSLKEVREGNKVHYKLKSAPNPSEIFWKNLYGSSAAKFSARLITYLISIFIIGLSLGTLFLLKLLQQRVVSRSNADGYFTKSSLTVDILAITTASAVFLINSVIASALRSLTMNEKHSTSSAFFQSLVVKITAVSEADQAQFINTNLLDITTYVVLLYRKNIKIHTDGSLLMDAWILLISHMLLGPLFNIFNLALLWRAIKKLVLKFRVWTNRAKAITQLEANRIFEMPTFDPAFAYSEVIRDAYLVLFLQPLFPVAGLISLMSLFLLYWSQKWRFLRKSTRPVQIGLRPARTLTYLLSLSPLVYGVASHDRR